MRLLLTRSQLHRIFAYLELHIPLEACGLLAGRNDRVEKLFFIRNQAQSPVRFVMEPYEQLQAFDWIDSHGMELLGIFHSHPSGPDTASATDIAEATYEVVHMICSCANGKWKVRGFNIKNGVSTEVDLQFVRQEKP